MIIKEPTREYNLDITDESSGVIAVHSAFAQRLPFFVYCSGQLYGKKDYFTRTHYLDGTLFLLTLGGRGKIYYQNYEHDLLPGSAVLLDCTQFHEYHTVGDSWENCYIRFDGSACKTYLQYINKNGFSVLYPEHYKTFKRKVDEVIGLCLMNSDAATLRLSQLITDILTALCNAAGQTSAQPQPGAPVMLAKEYIEKHYAEYLSLADIAEHAGITPYHFSRLFKAQTNLSPHQYLVHVRIMHAKRLLLTTQLYVQDVCERTGFSNVNVFIRSFKAHVGTTPSAFRSKSF